MFCILCLRGFETLGKNKFIIFGSKKITIEIFYPNIKILYLDFPEKLLFYSINTIITSKLKSVAQLGVLPRYCI